MDHDPTLTKVAYHFLRVRLREDAESFSALRHSHITGRLLGCRNNIDVPRMLNILDLAIRYLTLGYSTAKRPTPEELKEAQYASLAEKRAQLVQMTLVDEQDNLIFSESDIPWIMEWAPQDLDHIYRGQPN